MESKSKKKIGYAQLYAIEEHSDVPSFEKFTLSIDVIRYELKGKNNMPIRKFIAIGLKKLADKFESTKSNAIFDEIDIKED